MIMMLTAVRIRRQMLCTVLEPAHGIIHLLREPAEGDLLTAQQPLVSKTAADIRRDDPNAAVGEPEALAQAGLNRVRELRRCDQRQVAEPQVAISDDASAFHRKHAMPCGSDFLGDC